MTSLFLLVACSSMPMREFKVHLYAIDWEQRCISRNIEGAVEVRCYNEEDISDIIGMPIDDWINELKYTDVTLRESCKRWRNK